MCVGKLTELVTERLDRLRATPQYETHSLR